MLRINRHFVWSVFLILAVVINLMNVNVVLADDSTPPPPPTEEPTQPPVESTETPGVETPVSAAESPVTEEQAPALEEAVVFDFLTEIPENTDIVVLDENGNPVPLASQEAANIILEADPIWCPVGVSPIPNVGGCTIDYATPALLLAFLQANQGNPIYQQAGVIYLEQSVTFSQVLIDAAVFPTFKNYALTIKGGWNNSNNAPAGTQSTFDNNNNAYLRIGSSANPWVGSVTIQDIVVQDNDGGPGPISGPSLSVYTTTGNITLNNVDIDNQADGQNTAYLDSNSGNISVQNGSSFDGSGLNQGFYAHTNTGSISITGTSGTNLTFTDAEGSGTGSNFNGATLSAPVVSLTYVTADGNDLNGIAISNANIVTLNNVTATDNGTDITPTGLANNVGSGILVNGNGGSSWVSVVGGSYSNNQRYGLEYFNTTVYVGSNPTCTGNDGGCYNVAPIVDTTPPTITFVSRLPAPNGAGWNNSNVTVTWSCADPTSGVVSTTVTQTITTDGANQSAVGTCTNKAGLTASNTQTGINLDKTGPTAVLTPSGPSGSNGWFTGNVNITTTGTDISNPVTCTALQTLNSDSTGTTFNGSCTNAAGWTTNAVPLTVKRDSTAPTGVILTPTGTLGNNGWYTSNVTITTTGTDSISGPVTCTALQTLSSNSAGTSFNGSCTNLAGLSSNGSPITVKRDATAPTVNTSKSPGGNILGWNNTDVTITFSGSDGTSGIALCSLPVTVSTEGANQSRTGTCTDQAGNVGSGTENNINIDKTAPTVSGNRAPAPNLNGWNNTNVTVSFSGSDALSGISGINLFPLLGCSFSSTVTTEGANQSRTGGCIDRAGNITNVTVNNINIDKTNPVATATRLPGPNANGWNNTNVVVTFNGTDALSGIALCTPPATVSTEGVNQSRSGTCTDLAGNGSNTATASNINIDQTPPVITFVSRTPANANGWNNGNVTVTWSCTDALSGVVSATVSQTVTTEGANQSATGTCQDLAGNTSSNTQSGINIDKTAPTLNLPSNIIEEATGPSGATVNYTASASDNLDASPTFGCSPSSGATYPLGTTNVNCSATDDAGNTANGSFTVTVQDTTPPAITPMPNLNIKTTNGDGAPAFYSAPSTFDLVDGPGVATCSPASGSIFPAGDTIVTCSATDVDGNTSSITFKVHINYNKPTSIQSFGLGGVIPITGGELIDLDCFTVVNAFGIKVTFHNLCDQQAVIDQITKESLPGALPSGYSFVAGLNIQVLDLGQILESLPDDSGVQTDFRLPNGGQYAVLYWNDGQWVEITQLMNDGELENILAANAQNELYKMSSSNSAFYKVLTTDLTGTFVLVKN